MSTRKVNKRRLEQYAIGDMREVIKWHIRSLKEPSFNSSSFTEYYDAGEEDWASVHTFENVKRGGEKQFDDINDISGTTHKFVTRYSGDRTAEMIIYWEGDYYEIIKLLDPQNRHLYNVAFCRLKGLDAKEANT